jgi:hypothetical protein
MQIFLVFDFPFAKKRMSMCEKDQNLPWGYDLFRDPFAPPAGGYYGPPPGYCDGHCCNLHYGRGSQVSRLFLRIPCKKILHFPDCFAWYMCTSLSGVCYFFFLAAAAHPDETQLHSSQLAYDFYNNPPVGIYQPGAENIHNLP